MYQHVRKLALCARSLIYDVDNNSLEGYNSGLAKLNGGKRINNSLRDGFNTRCAGAVISHNDGRMHYWTHKSLCEKSPRFYTKKLEAAKLTENRRKKVQVLVHGVHLLRRRGFRRGLLDAYGNVKKTPQEIREFERYTVLQRESHEYQQLHQSLLSASSFHRVTQRRPYTSCAKIVKDILYSKFDNDAMKWGRDNEDDVIFYLTKCGLFIHSEFNFLAASPDGLIGDDTLIKCSYSAAELKLSPEQAIRSGK
ncbi:hypothetical protein B566_EDAN013827 [Ephemera danica]|nr:hypothetical protein B566_EDAN013827 [Ephemera danica]